MSSSHPTFVDVSHTVEHGMITYQGLPPPVICDYWTREASRKHYSEGTEFQIGKIEMVANTGTYLDAPFHRYAEGKDLSELPLESLAEIPAVVLRWNLSKGRSIGKQFFQGADLHGKGILIHTGWDRHWRTEQYFIKHPFLASDAARFLTDSGVRLVGIDSLNIDDTTDGARPVHSVLLKAGIPIVEHLCRLGDLPDKDFRFFAVPVKVKGFGSFPVRAFAIV